MKQLIFNELSIVPHAKDRYEAKERMSQFVQTLKKSTVFGFKHIRTEESPYKIQLAENYTMQDWLSTISKEQRDFMYGVIKRPYIAEEDEHIENDFINSNYYYKKADQNRKSCFGLAVAYLYELPSISLNTSEEWRKNHLPIVIEKKSDEKEGDIDSKEYEVVNLFSEQCFDNEAVKLFLENLGEFELTLSKLKPNEKNIHLADHHGKKELKQLCNNLKHSEYVVAIQSAPWGGNTFIRKVHKNGRIEITLPNTERRYALSVQTTGRNYRETNAIAKKLRERYS